MRALLLLVFMFVAAAAYGHDNLWQPYSYHDYYRRGLPREQYRYPRGYHYYPRGYYYYDGMYFYYRGR